VASTSSASVSSSRARASVAAHAGADEDEQLESLVARALAQQRLKPWQVNRWVIGVGDWVRYSSSCRSTSGNNTDDDNGRDARGGSQFRETSLPTLTSATPPDRLAAAVRALRVETALLCSNVVGVLHVEGGSSAAASTLSVTLASELAKDSKVRSDARAQREAEYWVVIDIADAARELKCMVLELAAPPDRPHRRASGRL
jgi:hypothetical protein